MPSFLSYLLQQKEVFDKNDRHNQPNQSGNRLFCNTKVKDLYETDKLSYEKNPIQIPVTWRISETCESRYIHSSFSHLSTKCVYLYFKCPASLK